MSELKGLKIKNATQGKVLTTDENGVAISSEQDINDIASANDLSNLDTRVGQNENDITDLDNRISNLESDVQDIADAIEEINGETI